MGTEYSEEILPGVRETTLSEVFPAICSIISCRGSSGGFRGSEASLEDSSEEDTLLPRPVHEQTVHGEEGWVIQASGESEGTEPLCIQETLQDGECSHAAFFPSLGGLDGNLKDASLSVPIADLQHRRLLRFQWREAPYEFKCLLFGLTSAATVFTKLMRAVMAVLRQRGVRCMIFMTTCFS